MNENYLLKSLLGETQEEQTTTKTNYKNAIVPYKKLNKTIKGIKFEVIPTFNSLSKETIEMKHAIVHYVHRVIKKEYIAIKIKDTKTKERATLGLFVSGKNLHFDELKAICNKKASKNIINSTLEFCKEHNVVIDKDMHFKRDLKIE